MCSGCLRTRQSRCTALAARTKCPPTGPEEAVVNARTVLVALAALTDRQRAVVVLRYYVDLSEAEIADALGIAPGTVKGHARAALAALASALERARPGVSRWRSADEHRASGAGSVGVRRRGAVLSRAGRGRPRDG